MRPQDRPPGSDAPSQFSGSLARSCYHQTNWSTSPAVAGAGRWVGLWSATEVSLSQAWGRKPGVGSGVSPTPEDAARARGSGPSASRP
jgi:hypothetical protein